MILNPATYQRTQKAIHRQALRNHIRRWDEAAYQRKLTARLGRQLRRG